MTYRFMNLKIPTFHWKSCFYKYLLYGGLITPIALIGQNVSPVITEAIPAQTVDQAGAPLEIDLKGFFNDPDVSDPAVQFDIRIGEETKEIHLALLPQFAPLTVANFIAYIEAGHFDDNLIHRSIRDFIIQGGTFKFTATQSIGDVPSFNPVKNEPGISNTRGTVSMAKLGGDPNSATSSWFINTANNALDLDGQNGGFTVFADVLGNGMNVADEVANLPIYDASFELGSSAFADTPLSAPNLSRSSFVETSASLIYPVRFAASSSDPSIATVELSSDGQLSISPSNENAGETVITITVTDLDNSTVQQSFTVTVEPLITTYNDWKEAFTFEDDSRAAQSSDPDKDGLINLFEFAFGTHPLDPTVTSAFMTVMVNGDLQLSFGDKLSAVIEVESSSDLNTWTPIWSTTDGELAQPIIKYVTNEGINHISISAPEPISSSVFWRVKIDEPDS